MSALNRYSIAPVVQAMCVSPALAYVPDSRERGTRACPDGRAIRGTIVNVRDGTGGYRSGFRSRRLREQVQGIFPRLPLGHERLNAVHDLTRALVVCENLGNEFA